MPTTLFLSTHPGDALFGAGALLASLPASETFHVCAYAPQGVDSIDPGTPAAGFDGEKVAFDGLGVQAIEGSLVAPPNTIADQALATKLSALLADLRPYTVILPLGAGLRDGDLQLTSICARLRQSWPQVRWLQYYDQPFIGLNRGRYPELTFARRVRMLAEVDEDASMFNWHLARAPSGKQPLERKLEACLSLGKDELEARFYTPRGEAYPTNFALVRERVARVLGQREWFSTLS